MKKVTNKELIDYCNSCGELALTVETECLANRSAKQYKTDYCPHCGADMRRSKGKTYV